MRATFDKNLEANAYALKTQDIPSSSLGVLGILVLLKPDLVMHRVLGCFAVLATTPTSAG